MRTRQAGLTLLEVLIAVLVLAIGLLGMAGLQTTALTTNFVSYQYTQAALAAQSMLERMRANRGGVLAGGYALAAGAKPAEPSVNCALATCAANQQALWDIAVWYAGLRGTAYANAPTLSPKGAGSADAVATLPNSTGAIVCPTPFGAASICSVTVYWDANRTVASSSPTLYSCDSNDDNALRCLRLAFSQ